MDPKLLCFILFLENVLSSRAPSSGENERMNVIPTDSDTIESKAYNKRASPGYSFSYSFNDHYTDSYSTDGDHTHGEDDKAEPANNKPHVYVSIIKYSNGDRTDHDHPSYRRDQYHGSHSGGDNEDGNNHRYKHGYRDGHSYHRHHYHRNEDGDNQGDDQAYHGYDRASHESGDVHNANGGKYSDAYVPGRENGRDYGNPHDNEFH